MSAVHTSIAVTVNGRSVALAAPSTLAALVDTLKLPSLKGVAAAVNDEVVPRAAWESHALGENDRVLVIKATQGG